MRAQALAFVLVAGSCASGPDPLPFRGPQPYSVLVAPAEEELDAAIAAVLGERGYAASGGADALGKLVAAGWEPGTSRVDALPLGELRERFGIEAVWVSEVRRWDYGSAASNSFSFDVRGSLIATRDAREIWSHELRGAEQTVRRRAGPDPLAANPDPFEADDPISWRVVVDVLTPAEVARLVAHDLGVRIPRR